MKSSLVCNQITRHPIMMDRCMVINSWNVASWSVCHKISMQVNIDINKNINSSIYLETGSGLFGPGQFGPGQFGPRQFDTRTIRSRIIRYQDNSVQGQFGPGQFGPEMTITQKIKIGKIWNLILFSIQPILNLTCKFDTFEKKMILMFLL